MKIPTYQIKGKKKAPIWFSGDWHLGHEECDIESIIEYINYIKESNGYVFLMGDLMEASIPGHMTNKGIMWGQISKPQDQIDQIIELLKPIKSRIIAAIRGNHENRIYFRTNIDPMKIICDTLNVPIYLPNGGYIKLKYKKNIYNIVAFHGSGASQNPRYQIQKALSVWGDVDIIALGHNHQLYHEIYYKHGVEKDKQVMKETHGIRTGGFLEYPDYAKRELYPPSAVGSPIVMLYEKKKIISVNTSGFITKE